MLKKPPESLAITKENDPYRKRIAEKIGVPQMRFRDLRHTYTADSIYAGDDCKTVQSNLGHAAASFTPDVYGHMLDEMKKRSAEHTESMIQWLSS